MQQGRTPVPNKELGATEWVVGTGRVQPVHENVRMFLGDYNLGVSGNSNRALRWFMESDCDHLLLCNDDLFVEGDFADFYAQAHTDLGIGLLCFCDFTKASPAIGNNNPKSYEWITQPWRGYGVKLLPRMTGIMMSMTREVVEKIGYFDTEFGQFGEEHVDYTHRARFAGQIQLDGQDMHCLDVEHKLLRHQDVPTSLSGVARRNADARASSVMERACKEYKYRHYYRPFRLQYPDYAGAHSGAGVSVRLLEQLGYTVVGTPT